MMRLIHSGRFVSRNTFQLRFYSDLYQDAKLRQIIETSNMAPKKRQLEKDNVPPSKVHSEKEVLPKITPTNPSAETAPFIDKPVANSETRADAHAAANASTNTDSGGATNTDFTKPKGINTEAIPGKISVSKRASPLIQLLAYAETTADYARRWKNDQVAKVVAALPRLAASINSVTGYDQIEMHKNIVTRVEQQMEEARIQVRRQKQEYEDAIERRSSSQKEINELLTRKHEWTPHDVERFTELYKNDHLNQKQENAGKVQLAEAENRFESLQVQLTSSILTRYHEEQLWSDKIRGASTWGTWMLMGVNIALFAVATFFVEPWKRKKLVTAFEAEVAAKLSEFSDEIHNLSLSIDRKTAPAVSSPEINDFWAPFSVRMQKVQVWASNWMKHFRIWVQNAYSELCQSPNFQFLQSKADISIYSSLLILIGWSLSRFSI